MLWIKEDAYNANSIDSAILLQWFGKYSWISKYMHPEIWDIWEVNTCCKYSKALSCSYSVSPSTTCPCISFGTCNFSQTLWSSRHAFLIYFTCGSSTRKKQPQNLSSFNLLKRTWERPRTQHIQEFVKPPPLDTIFSCVPRRFSIYPFYMTEKN